MAEALLTRRRIRFRAEYERADKQVFDRLLAPLLREQFVVAWGDDSLVEEFPAYEKVFWKPTDNVLTDSVDRDGTVSAGVVAHQGMHSICARGFGDAIDRDPALVLLGEAMATMITFYFTLQIVGHAGARGPAAVAAFEGPTPIDPAAVPALKQTCDDYAREPLDVLRSLARETFDLLALVSRHAGPHRAWTRRASLVRTHVRAMRHPWLATRLDVSNNVLYAKSRCALPLTPARAAAARRRLDAILVGDSVAAIVRNVERQCV